SGDRSVVPGIGPCATDPAPTHASLVPKTLEVPVPYPAVTVDPGEPSTKPVRTKEILPANPCTNPCPDLTDAPNARPSLLNHLGLPNVLLHPQPFYFALPPGPSPRPNPGPPPPPEMHPQVQTAPQAQQPAPPRVSGVTEVAKETGASSVNRTDKRWQV